MSSSRTVKTALASKLRDDIVRGSFEPGARLRLEQLAKRYDVSTMPIREAISVLESEGIVVTIPHKGALVTKLSSDELREIYEIRANLEKMATLKAVPRMNVSVLEDLEQLIAQMDDAGTDSARFSELNTKFHNCLYACSGKEHLSSLIQSLRHRTQHYLHAYIDNEERFQNAQKEHRKLLELCKLGEAEKAGELMIQHVYKVGLSIANVVELEEVVV